MSLTPVHAEGPLPISERRRHARRPVRSLIYLDLGRNNGGIVLNLGEGGMAIQVVEVLIGDTPLPMRFQLPQSYLRIEAKGQIVWTSKSKTEAGIRFVDLPQDARIQIKGWVSSGDSPVDIPREATIIRQERKQPAAGPPTQKPTSPMPPARDVLEGEESRDPFPRAYAATPLRGGEPQVASPPAVVQFRAATRDSVPSQSTSNLPKPSRQDAAELVPQGAEEVAPKGAAVSGALAAGSNVTTGRTIPKRDAIQPDHFLANRRIKTRRRWALEAVSAFVAVVSLVLGFAFGRGSFDRLLSKRNGVTNTSAMNGAPTSAGTAPNSLQADGAVARNQRRFTRASRVRGAPGESASRNAGGTLSPAPRKSASKFQVPRLLSPFDKQRAQTAGGSGIESQPPPPSLAATPSDSSSPISSIVSRTPSPAPPAAQPQTQQSGERLDKSYLIYRVEPAYPEAAVEQHIEGIVKMRAVIGRDGRVQTLVLLSGPPLLVPAAMNAARDWRYIPAILDGKPIESEQDISIEFRLAH